MSSAGDSNPAPATAPAPAPAPDASLEAPARESMSLKRGREGSVDLLATPSIIPVVTKKNRIEEETAQENTDDESTPLPEAGTEADADAAADAAEAAADAAAAATPIKEGRTVGEVRKKVEEMTWKEGEKPDGAAAENGANTSIETDAADIDSDAPSKAESDTSEAQTLKRKAEAEGENGVASEEKKRKSTSPTPVEAQQPTPAEPVKKPQATFGSFSAKASPFASAGTSVFGSTSSPSPFGAAASSSSPFGAAASSTSAFGAKSSSSSKGFASSGFGNYTNAFSTFAKKPTADDSTQAGPSASFGDILKERGEEVEETKLQLDKQDVPTGEENESTVYQTRVKLYAMDETGGWKERGVGSLKLNKPNDGAPARLVMRAEGVLRVILNSKLFPGMTCLEEGKHVRISVFEDTGLKHLTVRTGNPKVAAELAAAIHEAMPLESQSRKATESVSASASASASAAASPQKEKSEDKPAAQAEAESAA